MPKTDDCLTADGSSGEKDLELRIRIKCKDDAVTKLRAIADSMEADSEIIYCKPRWITRFMINWGDGGYP